MFNSNKKNDPFENSNSNSLFGKGTSIVGDISCDGDIRIDGSLQGNLNVTGKLIVGESASIVGELRANQAEIYGKINGKLIVDELLSIKSAGMVEGDLYAGKLQIEATATFNGVCHMTMPGSVVDINKEETAKTQTASAFAK
jgi:cytoskeletal protein CcmA (bactofilin family)